MARQRRTTKFKMPSFGKGTKEAFFRKLTGLVLIVIVLTAALVLGRSFVYGSTYFRLSAVETKGAFLDQNAVNFINSQLLGMYKATNVFRLNLNGIARSLQRSYPDAREITVAIMLPDKLSVSIKFRKPIAVVRQEKPYPIDEDGFVLPSVDTQSLKDMPVIEGAVIRYDERRARQSSSRNLGPALDLLKEIKKSRIARDYGVVTIYAKDPAGLSFVLRNGIEVRIGDEDFTGRLQALEDTLKDPRLALDRIKYIDVRFKDVIIGPK